MQASRTPGSSAVFSAISGPMPAGSPAAMAILGFFAMAAAASLPRHQRCVDHVGHALAADRFDGEVDILQAEAMRGDEIKWKAPRRELCERKLARFVTVPACALHRDILDRHFAERKIRE